MEAKILLKNFTFSTYSTTITVFVIIIRMGANVAEQSCCADTALLFLGRPTKDKLT